MCQRVWDCSLSLMKVSNLLTCIVYVILGKLMIYVSYCHSINMLLLPFTVNDILSAWAKFFSKNNSWISDGAQNSDNT